MTDKNVEAVREKLKQRAERGLSKYGVTTERTDLSMKDWITHAQEEAMDLAVYLERIKSDMNCHDCGEVNPADIHTCSPQANRLDATVFVYRHKVTGNILALYLEDALDAAKRDDLEHLDTLEPRAWIEAHYEQVSGAADPVQEPVAWMHKKHYLLGHAENMPPSDKALAQGWEPLYAHPPQRQPLTDAEIRKVWEDYKDSINTPPLRIDEVGFARAVIAAHEAKAGGAA